MSLTREQTADKRWRVAGHVSSDGTTCIDSYDGIQIALLMDIREELRRLNTLFHCHNAIDIPNILRKIAKNTTKPKRKRAVKK